MTISSAQFYGICDRALSSVAGAHGISRLSPYTCEIAHQEATVLVSYDPSRSQELTVGLRQHGQEDPPFELADVLRVTSCPASQFEKLALIQTGNPDALERLLGAASDALARYGDEFLRGSQEAFDRARACRSQRAAHFTERVNDAPRLRAADEAWHLKDMSAVADVLGLLDPQLSDRDRRRLEYARKTVAEGSQGS